MSHKHAKKIRQLYSRELEALAAEKIAQMEKLIKPKPTWMPQFLYDWCLSVVLR